MHFDHRKACGRLAELWRKRCDHRKACRRLAKFRSVRFDHRQAGRMLAELIRSVFTTAKRVGRLQKFVGSVSISTIAKCVGSLYNCGECVLTTAMRVAGLKSVGECVLSTP